METDITPEVQLDESELRRRLDPDAYSVLREAATEPPFTGEYVHEKRNGTYACRACGQELFSSQTKYDSGSGWPSFTEPENREHVVLRPDRSLLMARTEVLCKRCGSHLGHVFDDGPGATGERFCINSCALDLKPQDQPAS